MVEAMNAPSAGIFASSVVLARIEITAPDQPWLRGRLLRCAELATVAFLFERELTLLESQEEAWSTWEKAYDEIERLGGRLHRPDGTEVAEYLIHTDGTQVWFRWSDEPFPR